MYQAGIGAVLLQAAVVAAGTALGLFGVDAHVADLTGSAGAAHKHLVIHHDAAADAHAQGDHDGAVVPLGAALPHLAQGSGVDVVGHFQLLNGGLQLPHRLGHIQNVPAQVDAAHHGAVLVHRAGHTHAHAFDHIPGQGALCHLGPDGVHHIGQQVAAMVLQTGRNGPLFYQIACGLEQTDLNGVSAQIYAERIGFHVPLLLNNSMV